MGSNSMLGRLRGAGWASGPGCAGERAAPEGHQLCQGLPALARTLVTSLGVSLSTIDSRNSSGYRPPFEKLGNPACPTHAAVEQWQARQLELSRG